MMFAAVVVVVAVAVATHEDLRGCQGTRYFRLWALDAVHSHFRVVAAHARLANWTPVGISD